MKTTVHMRNGIIKCDVVLLDVLVLKVMGFGSTVENDRETC